MIQRTPYTVPGKRPPRDSCWMSEDVDSCVVRSMYPYAPGIFICAPDVAVSEANIQVRYDQRQAVGMYPAAPLPVEDGSHEVDPAHRIGLRWAKTNSIIMTFSPLNRSDCTMRSTPGWILVLTCVRNLPHNICTTPPPRRYLAFRP